MKYYATLLIGALAFSLPTLAADVNIGIVSYGKCIEESKIGKNEQETFETIKRQMTEVLEAKDQELSELSQKFSDADYLDSLTPEAEEGLREEFKNKNQELAQYQNQYYQVLNNANNQMINTISEMINEASKELAKEKNLEVILNEYAASYFDEKLDVTEEVIAQMDKTYEDKSTEDKE
jgi:outer membrane protein